MLAIVGFRGFLLTKEQSIAKNCEKKKIPQRCIQAVIKQVVDKKSIGHIIKLKEKLNRTQ